MVHQYSKCELLGIKKNMDILILLLSVWMLIVNLQINAIKPTKKGSRGHRRNASKSKVIEETSNAFFQPFYGTAKSIGLNMHRPRPTFVNLNNPYCDNRSVSGAAVGLLDQTTQYQYCNLSYISLSKSHPAFRNSVPQSQARLNILIWEI